MSYLNENECCVNPLLVTKQQLRVCRGQYINDLQALGVIGEASGREVTQSMGMIGVLEITLIVPTPAW
ncbi:hypothetical protein [Pseudomonas viridiflava]|uniref:hypothetical protein n=1 Tax=Pseudomonas viridiflava TaxID=33069 RepID=UPI002EC67E5B|nr:hypothetical protein [Pseudomonas viridiflava]